MLRGCLVGRAWSNAGRDSQQYGCIVVAGLIDEAQSSRRGIGPRARRGILESDREDGTKGRTSASGLRMKLWRKERQGSRHGLGGRVVL